MNYGNSLEYIPAGHIRNPRSSIGQSSREQQRAAKSVREQPGMGQRASASNPISESAIFQIRQAPQILQNEGQRQKNMYYSNSLDRFLAAMAGVIRDQRETVRDGSMSIGQ